ncbi:MAG: RagB/SusD family nutrient uptake outer membrane protein [Chitinophagaceae bacterium]
MKKLTCALILLITVLSLGSCRRFLEESPYSTVAPENFFKTASDAEMALTGVYDVLTMVSIQGQGNGDTWGRGLHYLTEVGNDELVTAANTTVDFREYGNYSYTAQTPTAGYTWIFLYAGINRANYILERVPAIPMDETRKKQILGEASFLRGQYYFYLGWLWGGVPIVTTSQAPLDAPRSPITDVMRIAEADFKLAYESLPARNTKPGRVDKYTAAGFLAKLYLYLGSCKEYQVGEAPGFPLNSFASVNQADMYHKVEEICADIYTNSQYTLLRPYRNLFFASTEADARAEKMMLAQVGPGGSSEYLFASNLSGPKGNASLVGGGYGFMTPLKEIYDKYNTNDGRMAHNLTGSIAANPPFEMINGEKYFTPGTYSTSTFSNLSLGKFRQSDPAARLAKGIPAWASETDFGILRYADVLLMYAEAKFKNGDEAGARQLFRELRLRAVADDATKLNVITTAYRKTDFMQELLDERSRELCGEGWRRFDLIRTGQLANVIASLKTTGAVPNTSLVPEVKANFADYKIWYPIPAHEIDLNHNLVQNPGYPR